MLNAVFFSALDAENKASVLKDMLQKVNSNKSEIQARIVDINSFSSVPGSPFCYWVPDKYLRIFSEAPPFESEGRTAKVGVQTSDDFRFVRAWWEVPTESLKGRWATFLKGGGASAFYSDIHLCLLWDNNGRELKAFAESTPGTSHWSRKISSPDWYFRPGLSWAVRTRNFSPSVVPEDCIFSVSRYQAFAEQKNVMPLIGLLNGGICTELLKMSSERYEHPKYIVGLVQSLPVPNLTDDMQNAFGDDALKAWSLKYRLGTRNEISRAFTVPAILQVAGISFEERVVAWTNVVTETSSRLLEIQHDIDGRCAAAYGVVEPDNPSKDLLTADATSIVESSPADEDEDNDGENSDEIALYRTTSEALAAELISWAMGVALGRFDPRHATNRPISVVLPDPFAKLPIRSPGMLRSDESSTHARSIDVNSSMDHKYDVAMVSDRGHPEDAVALLRHVWNEIFENPEGWERDISLAVQPKSGDLWNWISQSFFEYHLKQYSKSKRKAPIYLQFSVPSGRYSFWLYSHKITKDTFFRIQQDVLAPKLVHEERILTTLMKEGSTLTAGEQIEMELQQSLVSELRDLADNVDRVAPLWNPNLDDGVILAMAPLWRLVPQHKSWQRELRAKWDELQSGRYDWSQVAMHLWPERVIPKCAADRSLAIAHNLLDNFWFEAAADKWKPRMPPLQSIKELVAGRTSPAVKDALDSLIEAPEPVALTKRNRKGKAS